MPPTVSVPAPAAAPALTAPAAPATPATPDLSAKPGESFDQYEARLGASPGAPGSGAGFGTPVPAKPVTDLSSAQDEVAKQLGFNSYEEAISKLSAPAQSTTDFYNQAYSAAGLDKLNSEIESRKNDLATATGNINDNPWLDEASRVGRVKSLQDLANGDIKNLTDQYNAGLKQVQTVVSNHDKDVANNKAQLTLLENQAKQLATTAAAPKTIKAANGATYKWNPTTQSFDPILPGKPPTPGKNGTPIPPASSTGTGPQFNSFQYTAKQLGDLNAKGLNQNDANGILQDIKNGQTLDNIRQQMTAGGIDPKLLDTIMYYVDPAHNTPAKTTKSSSSSRTL